jgi:extracellular factor (EF) 3-hydroxypalmitic acid methyl ester biosynthesis protein
MKPDTICDPSFSDQDGHGRVGDYAGLPGGEGADIVFRPDRLHRSEFAPIDVTVEVTADDGVHHADLLDVSLTGASFAWPADQPVEVGAVLSELAVRFDQHEAYRGVARVSSLRTTGDGTIAGVSLAGGTVDIPAMLRLRDVKAWTGRRGLAGPGIVRSAWRVPGHDRFKSLVAELRLLLAEGEERLTDMERALPWAVTDGEADSPARDALIERVSCELARDVVACSGDLDAALRGASRTERDGLREFSARHLHDTLMQSPWMHRARHKPLGYPGDFQVMNYAYSDRFSGPTLFARALSLCFLSTPAGEAVRTRKDLIKARLSEVIEDPSSGAPVRILSIAAGPAQEIFELLQEHRSWRRPVEITLFDQDKRALSYAYGRLHGLLAGGSRASVKVVYLHDSIKRLLLGADVFGGRDGFDAVYSCGLFDYLQTRTAISLCKTLHGLLAPRGTLYVGNMVPANPSRWFMELHLDWYLIYRETAELLSIGRAAAPDARIALVEEDTGVNPFIALGRA